MSCGTPRTTSAGIQRTRFRPLLVAPPFRSPAEPDLHRQLRARHSPTDCPTAASGPPPPPASRRGFPDRRCRTRSGCRSPRPAPRAWPANPGNTPPEPAQAAIAKAWLLLVPEHRVQVEPEARQRLAHVGDDAEVEQIRSELRPHQELGRQVGDPPRVRSRVERVERRESALKQAIAHRGGRRQIHVVQRRGGRMTPCLVEQLLPNRTGKRLGVESGADVGNAGHDTEDSGPRPNDGNSLIRCLP